MGVGNHSEALVEAIDRLGSELIGAGGEPAEIPAESIPAPDEGLMAGMLAAEDERTVTRIRAGLTRIAAELGGYESDFQHPFVVPTVLDGVTMVIRGEFIKGNRERLPRLMPDFVFLVALPVVEQDRALELSRRAAELIEAALRRERGDLDD